MTFPPGVHRVAGRVDGDDRYVVPAVTSKAEWLDAVAAALGFPKWYGRNWDAAADLLTDLGWLQEPHPVLVWLDPAQLADRDPEAHRTALDILAAAADARGLVVLLVDG